MPVKRCETAGEGKRDEIGVKSCCSVCAFEQTVEAFFEIFEQLCLAVYELRLSVEYTGVVERQFGKSHRWRIRIYAVEQLAHIPVDFFYHVPVKRLFVFRYRELERFHSRNFYCYSMLSFIVHYRWTG